MTITHTTTAGLVLRLLTAALAITIASAPAARSQDETWQLPLRAQADAEQKCELTFIVTYRELKVGDDVRLDGRLRCQDGREFDFTREKAHQKFTLRLCQPVYC